LGIWWLVDLILVLSGGQRDKQGRALAGYAEHKKLAWIITAAGIVASMVFSGVSSALTPHDGTAAVARIKNNNDAPAAAAKAPAAVAKPDAVTVQSWADDTFGSFTPVTKSGTGDNLVTLPAGATAGMVTATHDGSSNFSISVLDAKNASTGQLLVNTIGAYKGTSVYGFNSLGDGVTLQITADGPWSLKIAPISVAPRLAATGAGDEVFLYDGSAEY
jgi:hypothetical protein